MGLKDLETTKCGITPRIPTSPVFFLGDFSRLETPESSRLLTLDLLRMRPGIETALKRSELNKSPMITNLIDHQAPIRYVRTCLTNRSDKIFLATTVIDSRQTKMGHFRWNMGNFPVVRCQIHGEYDDLGVPYFQDLCFRSFFF